MKKIELTYEEVNCGLGEFYSNVGKHLMDDIMGYIFDCRHITISKEIQDVFKEYYKEKGYKDFETKMLLLLGGPKVNNDLNEFVVEVDDKFMTVANYKDMCVSDEVKDNVENYFDKRLQNYIICEVYHKSNHDADDYLYMVKAKKDTDLDDDYTVWTSWNETTQCLNNGHYGLTEEQANEVLKESFFDCTGLLRKED